jgi:hypothetical protein
VLGYTLRTFANGRKNNWDVWLPYAVSAINNAASTLGGHLTPSFIDRGQRPRLWLSLPDLRQAGEPVAAYATPRMKALEQEVQPLLHAAQQERKAKLDAGRVDTAFHVRDLVLLRTKELLDAADIGTLRPWWEGPFIVAAVAGPNAYTLTLPRRFKCSPTVNVDRLKPYHPRAGRQDPPGPVMDSDQGQEGEHVVEQQFSAAPQPQDPPWQDLLPGALAGPRLGRRLVGAGGAPRALPGARRRVRGGGSTAP